jgi:hypothetical protein
MKLICATHGHCFDGLSSAVLFLRAKKHGALGLGKDVSFELHACGYGPRQTRPESLLRSGGTLAILDYRYAALPELGYYFDHHRTAFENAGDREHFEARRALEPDRFIFDESASSCTKLLAEHLAGKAGLDLADLQELVSWADVVDSAKFESARAASNYDHPILRLVSVVEQYGDAEFLAKAVPILESSPLLDFSRSDFVERRYASIRPHQEHYLKLMRSRGTLGSRVAYVDITDEPVHAISKFAVYAEFPDARYSVVVARLKSALKISVGYNPWCGSALEHDIGTLCARHGGGGHPVVGGIAFSLDELERAKLVASSLAETLELGGEA